MQKEIADLLRMMFGALVAGIVTSVPLHEVGHLIGGLISSYRFVSISVFGVRIYVREGNLRAERRKGAPTGQCIMRPRCYSQNPSMLIAGGIAANLIVGISVLVIGAVAGSIEKMTVCIAFGGINLAMGLINAIPDSPTNDASTFSDAMRSKVHIELYNRIMLVYCELEDGCKYKELSEELLDAPDFYDSTLSAELALYRYYRKRDLYGDDETNRNLLKAELLKLTHYAPGTGITEAIEND